MATTGASVALREIAILADVEVSFQADFPMPMGLSPNVGVPIYIAEVADKTAAIRLQIDWTPDFGEPATTILQIS